MIAESQKLAGRIRSLHEEARLAAERGEYFEAKQALKSCVNLDPRDGIAWEQYGRVHFESGNYPLSVTSFDRAARIVGLSVESQVRHALSIARVGDFERGSVEFRRLLGEPAIASEDLLLVALGLHSVGLTYLAIQACRTVIQGDSGCAQAYFDLGYYCGQHGYPGSTVVSLMQKAVQIDPANARYRTALACQLIDGGNSKSAMTVVRDLGGTSLSSISCSNCLEKLIQLYRSSGDDRRLLFCRQRLMEIRLRGCGFDC